MLDFGYYCMDCAQGMAKFPDKYFDLAVVDPPYGIHQSGGRNKTRGKWAAAKDYPDFYGNDLESPPKEYFDELFRVSKNQVIWGANHFISKIPIDSSCWLVWDKVNNSNNFADCELAWTSFGGGGTIVSVCVEWNATREHERQRVPDSPYTKAHRFIQVDLQPVRLER